MKHWRLALLLAMFVALSWTADAKKIDVFVYTETVQWIAQPVAQQHADTLIGMIEGKPGIGEVINGSGKEIADWTKKHTEKKGNHVIVLYGDFPPQIYPDNNAEPDGSLAEEFLDAGNTFANSADYMFWGLGGRNEVGGLQNMMDIPGITMWDDNTPMTVTAEGKKLIPSLEDFATDRPFHVDQLIDPWELEIAFASNTGDQDGTRCDPCVVHNKETDGRLIQVYQTNSGPEPMGETLAEILLNWYVDTVGALDVEPEGKLSTTWGELKTMR